MTHSAVPPPAGNAEGNDRVRLPHHTSLGRGVRRVLVLALAIGGGSLAAPASAAAQGTWTPTNTTGAPSARTFHTAVWTGSKMIVWGGQGVTLATRLDTGGVYDPTANVWTATSRAGAPTARNDHKAVWTGSRMIVWGGFSGDATGGIYEPLADTWTATSTVGAPSRRFLHTAVWTGSEVIVWGGEEIASGEPTNTGAVYSPATDSWRATSTVGAPSARSGHVAVWTGSGMIVWGGVMDGTGGIYDPATDTWTSTSTVDAPSQGQAAVWTGSKMIVWGGGGTSTGGIYDPAADVWTATSTTGAPSARSFHTAVWTGSKMIVWGGNESPFGAGLGTGGVYDPVAGTWTATTTVGAPTARTFHAAVWSGSQMMVWGGSPGGFSDPPFDTGGLYFDSALLPPPASFHTVTPCRVADTRGPTGPSGGPALGANTARTFPVGGLCGVPYTAKAVAINVTVVNESDYGNLRLYAAGGALPGASTINFTASKVRANNAVIPLGTGGEVGVRCDMPPGSTGQTDFLFDVTGYFE